MEWAIPHQTADIFARLSRGYMISANSSDASQSDLYWAIHAHEAALRQYFAAIAFDLIQGPGYYYLARRESRSTVEDRVERMARLIERMTWLKLYDPHMGSGSQVTVSELLEAVQQQAHLRRRLRAMSVKGSPSDDRDRLLLLLRSLERESFAEQIQEQPPIFRILASFHYLEQLLRSLYIEP